MSKYISLSYNLSKNTPSYSNGAKPKFNLAKSISKGDSCNVTELYLTSHIGTHIDFPRHFFNKGKSGDKYKIDYFIFNDVKILEIKKVNELIDINDFNDINNDKKVELLLFKTGLCYKRQKDTYWKNYPGISSYCANFLKGKYPNLRAIGFDFISISSINNREEGRKAHKEFLKRNILIIEDMNLININNNSRIKKIILSPIIFENCDGALCSVICEIE